MVNKMVIKTANSETESNKDFASQHFGVVLWLVRHGKTMFNAVERVQGWSDTPLIQEGIDTVQRLAEGLKAFKFDAVYSSDSGRARQTAEILIEKNHYLQSQQDLSEPQLKTDWRLRELNFGAYEGELDHLLKSRIAEAANQTAEERQKNARPSLFADQVAALSNAMVQEHSNQNQNENQNSSWPAENYHTLSTRLRQVLTEIATQHYPDKHSTEERNILIVSHGVSIWTIWEMINGLDGYQGGGIKNASVMKLRFTLGETEQPFVIETANDLSYIK